MKFNLLFYQRTLLVCAVVFVIVALVLALGVIRPVKTDTYPGVTPDRAVAAFWVNIGLNLLSALTLFFIAIRSKVFIWISKSVLIIVGIIVLLLGIALADAASAYLSHGPSMQSASILLFICAAADFLGGALVVTTAFLRPNMKTKEKKSLFGIPSWGLSLLTALFSFIILFFLAGLLGSMIDENISEGIAYISYDIIIAIACFFICRHNPKSIWYVPILCNTMGIISAIVEPNFWITSLWIVICGGWVLSLIGAISGAMVGKRSILRTIPK